MTDRPNIEALADEAYHWAAALSLAYTSAGRNEYRAKHRAAINGLRTAALAAQAAAVPDRATIRRVFLENGFTIKPGQDDLKPYVYKAAAALLSAAPPAPAPVEPADTGEASK